MEKRKQNSVCSDHKVANRNGFFLDGLGRSSSSSSSLERDVFGFDLKMQPIQSSSSSYSYPCKRNSLTGLPPPLLSPPEQPSSGFTVFNGDDNGGIDGGGPSFCNTSYQVSSLSDIYYVAGLGDAVSSRTFLPLTSEGEGMTLFSRAAVFTASQRQELERQTIIYKYMMASLPVPPQLLLPLPNYKVQPPVYQSSTAASSAMVLRFSSRPNTEPWRCRRTDGKKWRCSRNVTHGQKYCERHAHKSRSRSRKPVEIQSKIAPAAAEDHSYSNLPISSTITQPIPHFPSSSIGSMAASCDPTSEGSGGTIPFWACNQQWQQQQQTMDLSRHENVELNKEEGCSVKLVQNRDNQKRISKMGFLPASNMTRSFIDAWSTADKEDCKKKESVTSGKKIPISSLALSIPGENEDNDYDDQEQGQGGNPTVGTMIRLLERNKKDAGQRINAVTGMNGGGGTLGGPLGEALCLGIASNNNSISTTTSTTSGCSRSSCEDAWW